MSIKRFKRSQIMALLVGVCMVCITSVDVGAVDNGWTDSEIILLTQNKGENPGMAADSDLTTHVIWISENSKSINYMYKTSCGDWSIMDKIYTSSRYADSGNYIGRYQNE